MNEGYNWDHIVEGDAVEGTAFCVCRDEMMRELNIIDYLNSFWTLRCFIGVNCC